jgi:signal transduction histidine kinase
MRAALADALQDPSLEIVEGTVLEPPPPESGRHLTEIRDGRRVVGGIVHDTALCNQHDLVEAVGSYALVALANRRLTGRVESTLREVRRSRARIMAKADHERRRLERDLHDGAQQKLVALRIQLELLEESLAQDPERARAKVHALGEDVGETLEEIRELAHGVYPSLLADRGLAEALRSAAQGAGIASRLDAGRIGRYPAEVESAVYFCCLEAIQNVSKHAAGAELLEITLSEDGALHFEVRDDGGGFNGKTPEGAGMTNMRDRLAAVGGEIEITSAAGRGTVVAGTVPLAKP